MEFCPNCNNILHYLEKEEVLYKMCNKCGYQEKCEKRVIERSIYSTKDLKDMEHVKYFIHDKTLPRTIHKKCPNPECPSKEHPESQEVVFYNNPDTMILFYICVNCNTEWK